MITQEHLKSSFRYVDGNLIKIKNGKTVGSNANGYLQTKIKNKCLFLHRLIYLYHYGFMPEYVDHIDQDTLNNKIENLRSCTKSQNSHNQKIRKNNKSGLKGVYWNKRCKKWHAQIGLKMKRKHLGFFNNLNDANEAMDVARAKYHKEFASSG